MSIRACLFDLDDTLIDRESAYTNVYKDYYYQEEVIRNSLDLNEAIDYFWSLSPNNTAVPIDSFKQIKARWPDVKGDERDHYKFYFESTIKHMKILPGVMEFIDWINNSEYNWGVVTNGNSYQYKKVEITGLTDKIPFFLLKKQKKVIGKNTLEALRAGFYWGYIGLISNIILKIEKETKRKYKIIFTGGYANLFKSYFKKSFTIDKNITIKGIIEIFKENRKYLT